MRRYQRIYYLAILESLRDIESEDEPDEHLLNYGWRDYAKYLESKGYLAEEIERDLRNLGPDSDFAEEMIYCDKDD